MTESKLNMSKILRDETRLDRKSYRRNLISILLRNRKAKVKMAGNIRAMAQADKDAVHEAMKNQR